MRYILPFILICSYPSAAQRVTCPTVADSWVAMHRWEGPKPERSQALQAHGTSKELIVQGRVAFALLHFDLSPAKGMTVAQATLRIHRQPASVPLHTLGLSTISGNGPWTEKSVNYFHPQDGQDWSYAGSDLVDVTFAQGGSLHTYERARDAGDGWWEIPVPPVMVHSLITQDQFGLMLTDEKGQTQTRHVFSSRESDRPPVLILEGTRSDQTAPGPVQSFRTGRVIESSPEEARRLGRTTLRPGSVVLYFGGAGDDAGEGIATRYDVRYSLRPIEPNAFESAQAVPRWALDPLAPKLHPMVVGNALHDEVTAVVEGLKPGETYYFAARAMDEAGNRGPVTSLGRYQAYNRSFPALPELTGTTPSPRPGAAPAAPAVWVVPELLKIDPRTGALLEQDDFPQHRIHNRVWDAAKGAVRLTGARNEFVAFQLAIESAQPLAGIEVQVSKPLFGGVKLPDVFKTSGAVRLYREWFVPGDPGRRETGPWYPDPLVPLEGPFNLPSSDNPVPGQTVQPVFVDVYIPHDAKPGRHTGELRVRAAGLDRRIALEVEVLPLLLPDKLSFVVDLNCYSGVDSGYPVKRGTPEYRKLEHAYHRMAHLHRTNLDVLGYSHMGTTVPDHAPLLEGEGAATRVKSWENWDALFGPLLSGSAFADLPRASVPVPAIYLPFFENWPGDLRRSYKYDDPTVPKTQEEYQQLITRHAVEAGPIEEGFSLEYQERFAAVAVDFARHLREQGWTNTRAYVYFNNKYYWKRPEQGGRGISWWLLDEPNHRDDVRAISFLGHLAKKRLGEYPDVPILFRTDISRVEWIRDMLAGQIDLNCVSRRFYEKNRYLQDDRHRFGREYWNYASSNHPRETNVSMRAWAWRVWLNGGDGLLPWNAVRGSQAWERAEPLTVFYTGSKFGKLEPYPSLRLKAYRRGQQDIEYLAMLAQQHGWDREAVTHAVSQALDLSTEVRMEDEEDAGAISFRNVKDADMHTVRLRVARALRGR